MNDSLRMRLGAVVLALLTIAAIVFAVLNFQQRSLYVLPDDGVTWMDSTAGVAAWHVVADSPAAKAGIKAGRPRRDRPRRHHPSRHRRHQGPLPRRSLDRDSTTIFSATIAPSRRPLVTAPQDNPTSIENYLRVTALLYLFIGLFIFVRRWNAPRAIHFYVFCLVSFILYSFHYTGKLNSFDWIIYWGNVVALLLQPALLVHFALVFPERRGTLWPKLSPSTPARPRCSRCTSSSPPARWTFSPRSAAQRLARSDRTAHTSAFIFCSPPEFSWRVTSARPAASCASS